MNDLFDGLKQGTTPVVGSAMQDLSAFVALDVIYRSQVGACIPFTVLPKHYLGKKVRVVIVGEADE